MWCWWFHGLFLLFWSLCNLVFCFNKNLLNSKKYHSFVAFLSNFAFLLCSNRSFRCIIVSTIYYFGYDGWVFGCSQRKIKNETEGRVFFLLVFLGFSSSWWLWRAIMENEEKRGSEREALQPQSWFHIFITRKILEIVFIIFWFCLKIKIKTK